MANEQDRYFKDYWAETDKIDDEFFITDSKGTQHIFDKEQVLVEILAMPNSIKKKIRHNFVIIDFKNGDPNHFIKYILKGLVK